MTTNTTPTPHRHTHPRPSALRSGKGWRACLCMLAFPLIASAQVAQSTSYYLPKVVARFTIKVEKTQYTPGRLATYARRYLKKDVPLQPYTAYRLIGTDLTPVAVPDTAKRFELAAGKKHSISKLCLADNGRLLAINAEAAAAQTEAPTFVPAQRAPLPDPANFMTEDMLNAGSHAKMAELVAREIYDIRDSRNQLNRGEADYMPKDGAQLRIMLANLARQEQALTRLFEGDTAIDTTYTTVDYLPTQEGQEVLFRLSAHLGPVDKDDLAGEPYYVSVKDNHTTPMPATASDNNREDKNDIGLRAARPGKITLTLSNTQHTIATYELSAPQFGTVETLSGELFGRKNSSRLVLDPLTGSIRTIEAIPAE